MSAIQTYKRVYEADVLKLEKNQECHSFNFGELIKCCASVSFTENSMNIMNSLVTDNSVMPEVVTSPLGLRTSIQEKFFTLSEKAQTMGASDGESQKIAFAVLSNNSYLSSHPDFIKNEITPVFNATSKKDISASLSKAFTGMENEHTKVFVNTLSSICHNASEVCGFNSINMIQEKPHVTRIVAKNNAGQVLITEININSQSKDIEINSQTIGFQGQTCQKIHDKFDEVLTEYGVKASSKQRNSTLRINNPVKEATTLKSKSNSESFIKKLFMLKKLNEQNTNL